MEACAMPASVPEVLAAWMQPFAVYFTTAVWRRVLVLVAGALLAPGRRTVTATLRSIDPAGCGRHRRHHGAAPGRADQGARHLPRSGALQPWSLRQSQWPALVVRDATRAGSLGRLCLGAAVPERAGSLRTLRD